MTRDEIIAMLEARDPLAAAEGIAPPTEVGWMREPVDADGVVEVRYGAGTTAAQVADQLLAVARDTSGARAVQLVPGDDSAERPGSWGNEDLLVTAVARRVLPDVAIRPHWRALGGPACQVAVSFGADEWVIPQDDDADPDRLAAAVGAVAVAR